MTLPTSRDVTLATGSQVPSSLLNNLQDMIISGKHGNKILQCPASSAVAESDGTPTFNEQWTFSEISSDFQGFWRAENAGKLWVPVPLHVGDRIRSVKFWLDENSEATGLTCAVTSLDGSDGSRNDEASGTSTGSGTYKTFELTSIDYTIVTGTQVQLSITAFAANQHFIHAEVTYDRQ